MFFVQFLPSFWLSQMSKTWPVFMASFMFNYWAALLATSPARWRLQGYQFRPVLITISWTILGLANLYKTCPITALYFPNNLGQWMVVFTINNISIKCSTRWPRNVHSFWPVNGEIGFCLTKTCDQFLPVISILYIALGTFHVKTSK